MTSLIDLRPNSSLLDPDFSGYKLSLDTIPVYRRELKNGKPLFGLLCEEVFYKA